jgi:tetratricopeptide (TPR) repeat protein
MLANADRALELARRVGDRRWESMFLAGPGGTLMMLGRWDDSISRVAEAEGLVATEFARGFLFTAAPIHVYRGDFDRLRKQLAANESMSRSENFAAGYALTEALLHGSEGRLDEALAAVDRGLGARLVGHQAFDRFLALEAVGGECDEQKLRKLLDVVGELHPGEQAPFLRAEKARFRARLPERDAEADLAEAERLFAESEMPFHVAAARLERAEHLLGQGRVDEARSLLDQARETFERLGARPWLERTETAASALVPA